MKVIIIGAGASGLACAIRLKQNNPSISVTIFERLEQPGKKILATGNGRCNLSNLNADENDKVISFFSSIGLVTRADDEGRIYPYSNRASTVLDMLIDECARLKVEIISSCNVIKIDKDLTVHTEKGCFKADRVVIACGGCAQSSLGSNGSGYEILKNLGHKITPISPALVQLTSPSKYPRKLKGSRFKCNVSVTLDNEVIESQFGEVLFTDYGLSGIVIMNLSQIISENFSKKNPKKAHVILDLVPDMGIDEIESYLNRFDSLEGILGNPISQIIYKQAEGDIKLQAKFAKNWKLIVNGTKGFNYAQITCGGADRNGFNNFESKSIEHLYACGEILDVQFPCGGYNLNFAWLSGIKTADNITKTNKRKGAKNI